MRFCIDKVNLNGSLGNIGPLDISYFFNRFGDQPNKSYLTQHPLLKILWKRSFRGTFFRLFKQWLTFNRSEIMS